ncbi:hypothetical protein Q2T42_07620 [Leptolyngbya boryana CZ1]|uniref:Uncharacterized protein n=1 Tax=Leptolyngbya boryana CZ1 TaxID=3060204 RepID=A0AA96X0R3_LEPBY|nr:hypothetical protein [Leptolyngbya boryana]WNZ47699.1 hypothetical protein Q2T42_07620 [Leptolyngbya boryana CZ1]
MNRMIEKWLTIAALAGWVASIAGLVGLAIRATDPPAVSRAAQSANVRVQKADRLLFASPRSQSDSVAATVPVDTSKGYWQHSLKPRSQPQSLVNK